MAKIDKFSAFQTLVFKIRFLPNTKTERTVGGKRIRQQRWSTSCNVILLDKKGKILRHRIANGLEEIPVVIKRLVRSAGMTIDTGIIRPKKKPGPKSV